MAAKDVKFDTDARNRMLKGVNILADAVKVPWARKAATWCSTNLSAHRASPKMV